MSTKRQYIEWTVIQLIDEIKKRGLKGYSKYNKDGKAQMLADDDKKGKRPEPAARVATPRTAVNPRSNKIDIPTRRGRGESPQKSGIKSKVKQKRLNNRLSKASQQGNVNEVEALIERGANVNAADKEGRTALMKASSDIGNWKVVEALIERGANVNATDRYGWTALTVAALYDKLEVVKVLIREGANVDAVDEGGWTVLIRAASMGHLEIVEELVQAGADPEIRNKEGRTSRDYWRGNKQDFDEIVSSAEETRAGKRMIKAARSSPSRSRSASF